MRGMAAGSEEVRFGPLCADNLSGYSRPEPVVRRAGTISVATGHSPREDTDVEAH